MLNWLEILGDMAALGILRDRVLGRYRPYTDLELRLLAAHMTQAEGKTGKWITRRWQK